MVPPSSYFARIYVISITLGSAVEMEAIRSYRERCCRELAPQKETEAVVLVVVVVVDFLSAEWSLADAQLTQAYV